MKGQLVTLRLMPWEVPFEEGEGALGRRLLPHQAALASAPPGAYVVHTPTGSGKTFAALLRYLKRAETYPGPFFGLLVYPTNALLEDQARQLRMAAEAGGYRVSLLPGEEVPEAEFGLLVTTGETLDGTGGKGRRLEENLDRLLHGYRRGLWLTNPDTLFYLLQLYYGYAGESIKYLSNFRYWVLDEFHLYEGGLLAEVAFLLDRVAARAVEDLVVMTATPSAAGNLVRRWWPRVTPIGLEPRRPVAESRIIRHAMTLTIHPSNGRFSLRDQGALERLLAQIQETFEAAPEVATGSAAARTLVIVDSVAPGACGPLRFSPGERYPWSGAGGPSRYPAPDHRHAGGGGGGGL